MNNLLETGGVVTPVEPAVDSGKSSGSRPWWDGEWIIPGVTHYLPEKPPEDVTPLRPKVEKARARLKKARPPKIDHEYRALAGKIGALSKSTASLERQAAKVVREKATEEATRAVVDQYRILAARQQEIEDGILVLEQQAAHRQRIEEDDMQAMNLILDLLDEEHDRKLSFF